MAKQFEMSGGVVAGGIDLSAPDVQAAADALLLAITRGAHRQQVADGLQDSAADRARANQAMTLTFCHFACAAALERGGYVPPQTLGETAVAISASFLALYDKQEWPSLLVTMAEMIAQSAAFNTRLGK